MDIGNYFLSNRKKMYVEEYLELSEKLFSNYYKLYDFFYFRWKLFIFIL